MAAGATLNIAGIIAVVLLLLPIVGYNSTAQAFPKAVIDGLVLAMLIGRQGRWRTVALLGGVVGTFLAFVMPAIPPLLAIYAIAGFVAAGAGWTLSRVSRRIGITVASMLFSVFAGAGIAAQVYFASHDRREPFLWSLVGIELLLRSLGAPLGVLIGRRWAKRLAERGPLPPQAIARATAKPRRVREAVSPAYTLVILSAGLVGCTVPMFVQNVWLLAGIAIAYALLAIAVNQAKVVVQVAAVLVWGWAFYGLCSYGWHRDASRVLDFGRTLGLRFFPLAAVALIMIRTVRAVAIVRLLRRARVSGAVVLPLSMVLRAVPTARRDIIAGIDTMKAQGVWVGRLTPLRRPVATSSRVLAPLLARWGGMLAE